MAARKAYIASENQARICGSDGDEYWMVVLPAPMGPARDTTVPRGLRESG